MILNPAIITVNTMRAVTACHLSSAALIIGFLIAPDARAECVFLKSGALVSGSIVKETGSAITVKTAGGALRVIQRGHVLRILYTDMYLGKLVIRLTDGSVIEAYLVDENADYYTLRDRLDYPDEYTLPRKKVLFMARTNPTDLTGKSGGTFAHVSWFPPYRPPRSYRLYVSERGSGKIQHVGTTRGLSYQIRGLKEKTRYRISVTAVDDAGTESLPADAIELMTNTPPDPPSRARLERLPIEKERIGARITWRPANDPDGEIVQYRIYSLAGNDCMHIGETTETEFVVRDLDPSKIHHFAIRAIDNDGVESVDARVNSRVVGFDISGSGCFILPVRKMGAMLEPGPGVMSSISILNFPAWGLAFGPGAGYFYFRGRGGSISSASMAPFFFFANYRFMLADSLSIAPCIRAGFSFIWLSYSRNKPWIQNLISSSRMACEPLAMAGLVISYMVGRRIVVQFGADYAIILERNNCHEFILCHAGLGIRI